MESCVAFIEAETDEPAGLSLVGNVPDAQVIANVHASLERGLPELEEVPPHDRPVCIVGGGPSVAGYLPELMARKRNGQAIWALNGAHDWLVDHGISPDAAWLVDSRPDNAAFYEMTLPHTAYYIAGRCDPAVFDALEGRNVTVWWDQSVKEILADAGHSRLLIGGGTTVGMKALCGAYALGYRTMHLYGYDSSYGEVDHHVYRQPLNDGETIYEVRVGDGPEARTFRAAGWMLGQAKNYGAIAPALAEAGCRIVLHGDGLLYAIEAERQRQMAEKEAA